MSLITSCPLGLHISKQLEQTTNISLPGSEQLLILEITAGAWLFWKEYASRGRQAELLPARCARLRSHRLKNSEEAGKLVPGSKMEFSSVPLS